MILVDSSIWIDIFAERSSASVVAFENAMSAQDIAVGDLIMVEVLQGFRLGPRLRLAEAALRNFSPITLCGPEIAPKAASNYRLLRQRGVTIRGTIDVIIATWCIVNEVSLLHNDRDFDVMESELGLVSWRA